MTHDLPKWQTEAFFRYGYHVFIYLGKVMCRDLVRGPFSPYAFNSEPPQPHVGQVWADANVERSAPVVGYYTDSSGVDHNGNPVDVNESMIVSVCHNAPNKDYVDPKARNGYVSYRFFFDVGAGPGSPSTARTEWPPPGAVLVSGPGAPWAPPVPSETP